MKVLNQEKIALGLSRLVSYFDGGQDGGGILELIKKSDYDFAEVLNYLPEQSALSERITSARYELQDIADTIESIKDDLTFDEFAAEENERRLDLLSSLKKKYGSTIEEINEYLLSTKAEYEKVLGSAEIVEKLEKEKQELILELNKNAKILSNMRKNTAKTLENKVLDELSELSMKNSKFEIDFSYGDENNCDETGFDRVEFMFSANAGQPLRPLNKVVSGGEMSRFMLAVKNITADTDMVDTMIFDEIDTGISGDTANALAVKLAKIGKKHQVICVTHLAQVASFGKNHFYISKSVEDNKTKTSLKFLEGEDRVYEIARLIGGAISDFSLSHAKLMLDNGSKF